MMDPQFLKQWPAKLPTRQTVQLAPVFLSMYDRDVMQSKIRVLKA